jgi:hypothetical protein
MGWFSILFGGARQKEPVVPKLTEAQLRDLTRDYEEVLADEGATGRPADYASNLTYVPPSRDFPGQWPDMPLCGCCSVPFAIDPRKLGLWVAKGAGARQLGKIVPLCAVCITYLNRVHGIPGEEEQFPLSKNYDAIGQQMCTKFPLDDLKRLAVCRVALLRKKWSDTQ